MRPVPGAKRGRPTAKQGRSKAPLRQHSDRYSVAIFDAVVALYEMKRMAARIMVTMERLSRPSSIISRSLKYPLPQAITDDFNKVADRVRSLARWYSKDADDLKWRKAMSDAIMFTIACAGAGKQWRQSRPLLGHVIIARAEKAGEAAWARRVLLPLMQCEPAHDMAERNEKMVDLLQGAPNFPNNQDERLLQILIEFYTLRANR